jgi:anti-repressor protein
MNELIKIENKNGIETVNAREFHCYLENKRQFSDWIKQRIEQYDFIQELDYTIHKFVIGKATQIDYYISIEMAKQLSMVENNDKGKKARLYFIECENKLKNNQIKSDDEIIAIGYAKAIEKIRILEYKIQEDKPKIDTYNALIDSDGLYSMSNIAKSLNTGRNKLFKVLRDSNVLMSNNEPYQKFCDNDYFTIRYKTLKTGETISVTKVTPKGLIYIEKLLKRG